MFDRINIFAVLRGHWKGLTDRDGPTVIGADLVARGVLLAAGVGTGVLAYVTDLELTQPGVLFAGLSLLTGALLAAFAQIAGIRARFPGAADHDFAGEADVRNMLDEAVAHILTAALIAATTALLIIVAMNVHTDSPAPPPSAATGAAIAPVVAATSPGLSTAFSVPVAALGAYLFVLFLMTIRKLYAAYVIGNEVAPKLSGHHRG